MNGKYPSRVFQKTLDLAFFKGDFKVMQELPPWPSGLVYFHTSAQGLGLDYKLMCVVELPVTCGLPLPPLPVL